MVQGSQAEVGFMMRIFSTRISYPAFVCQPGCGPVDELCNIIRATQSQTVKKHRG